MAKELTYKDSGVDIDKADALKAGLKNTLRSSESRVLNSVGAFSALFDVSHLEGITEPVLCLKMEEPGSKQLLASQHGQLPSVGVDLVNHLINDTIMNGGRPLAILDTIVCGKLEPDLVSALIKEMVEAAVNEGCSLVGGETSEQPRVLEDGTYVLSAACVGVVDKPKIIDGSAIAAGDVVFAVASNGIHTNGYTLVRSLLDNNPELKDTPVGNSTFLEAALLPHLCYNTPLQQAFAEVPFHGLAHITGGGVVDNIARVLPENLDARIDLTAVEVPEIFSAIQRSGNIPHDDMLRTFNCGVGMAFIGNSDDGEKAREIFSSHSMACYQIGEITPGSGKVVAEGELAFS